MTLSIATLRSLCGVVADRVTLYHCVRGSMALLLCRVGIAVELQCLVAMFITAARRLVELQFIIAPKLHKAL